jgi:hypothetical protein
MTELNPTKSRTLGPVALGIVSATLAIGCAASGDGSAGPNDGETTGVSKAAIISRGITVNGCVARGVFDITAPTPIGFVAVDPSNLRNAQLQLFTVDGQGAATPVQMTAQTPSSQLQSALDAAPGTLRDLTQTTSATAPSTMIATPSSNIGSIVGTATAGNTGGTSGDISGASSNQRGASAWMGGTQGDSQSIGTSAYATNEGDQSHLSISHQSSFDGNQAAAANANNGAQNVQSAASQSSASTLAFSNLSQLDSIHMMLVVNVTASMANSTLRLFQGTNGVVTAAQNFPIVTPACGAGA